MPNRPDDLVVSVEPRNDGGHTPLPWLAMQPDEVDVFVPIIGVRLGDDGEQLDTPTNGLVGGATLFPTEIDAEDYERAKANAAFIVRAANSHYALIEALSAAILEHDAGGITLATAREMRAALAKANPHQEDTTHDTD